MIDVRAWTALIDGLAPRLLGRDDRTGEPLAAQVRRVSELYTRRRDAMGEASAALAARMRFFLPRDLPKVGWPLAELAGTLPPGPRWRILDVGAGLGTMTLGVAALAGRRGIEQLEVTAVERDAAALDIFSALAHGGYELGLCPPIELRVLREDLERLDIAGLPQADLVLVGLALNELYLDRGPDDRRDATERMLRKLIGRVAPGGALIVIEPALKETSRALQVLRGRLLPHVYAPCLREGECPLLRKERDWCHAMLPQTLPAKLAKVARAAGLRQERLTFSYLTLRPDGRRLGGHGEPDALRVVGGPVASKGKTEWDACGEVGMVRLRRLDRERSDENAALDGALRGTRLRVAGPLSDGASVRVRSPVTIEQI